MEFPKPFNKLLRQIDQDFFVDGGTWGELLPPVLGILTEAERLEVRRFLDGLLSAPFDVAEVERLWQKSGAQIGVSNADEAMPFVLAEIRDVFVNYRERGWPGRARP